MDNKTTIGQLKKIANQFVNERDWDQFHSLKNLSAYIAIEASELMEIFVWARTDKDIEYLYQKKHEEIEHEVADILLSLLSFCNKAKIDLSDSFFKKMEINKKKYPIEKVKGKFYKYFDYKD